MTGGETAAINLITFIAVILMVLGALALFGLIIAGITALLFDGTDWLLRKGWRYSSDFPHWLKDKYR